MVITMLKSKKDFMENAVEIPVKFGETELIAVPREFSTGTLGYRVDGLCVMKLKDGREITCKVNCNIFVNNSKYLRE